MNDDVGWPPFAAVVVGAGEGNRFGNRAKIFEPLRGTPVLSHSLQLFASLPFVQEIIVVLGPHTMDQGVELIESLEDSQLRACLGGETRTASVRNGLLELSPGIGFVAVHDAARPLASPDLVRQVCQAAVESGAAVPGLHVGDTAVMVDAVDMIEAPVDRGALRTIQTPQVARRDWLVESLNAGADGTDESSLLRAAGFPVRVVPGEPTNLKITWPADLLLAEAILAQRQACRWRE